MKEGNGDGRVNGERSFKGFGHEKWKHRLGILFGVQGLGIVVAGVAFFSCKFRLLFLEFAGV